MSDENAPLLSPENGKSNGPPNRNGYDATSSDAIVEPVVSTTADEESGDDVIQDDKSFKTLAFQIMPMMIGTFLAATDATIVASSYASIGSELKQLQNTSWIATAYMLTLASFQPLYGKMSDIFGRKQCLLFAYVVFALGALWCGLARNMEELIIARAFAGIGGGGMTTVVSIIMSDIIPLRSRGTWQGFINICFASGSAAGAPLGGLLADSIGWRWAFLLQAPITVLAVISVSLFLKLPARDESHWLDKLKRVDFGGAAALVICITALLIGLDHGGNVSWSDRTAIISLILFATFFALFAVIELKLATEPFAPKRIVANTSLLASYLCNFFCVASSMALIFHIAMYIQAVEHKSAANAGLALIPGIIAGVAGSLMGGLVMQHTGKYYVYTATLYFVMVAGTLVITLTTGAVTQSFIGIEVGLVLMSLGNGSGITTTLIALIANAGAKDQAIATAVSYLFRSLGSVIGLSVGSTLFQDSLRKYLRAKLDRSDIDEIVSRVRESLDYVDELDPTTRAIVRTSYEDALQICFWFTVMTAGCAFLSSLFVKEKALVKK